MGDESKKVEETSKYLEKRNAVERGIKDSFVFVPLIASGLAITWEVGFFTRIGGGAFDLFSFAEHITFALEALPIAIAVSAILVAVAFQWDLMNTHLKPIMEARPTEIQKRVALNVNLIGVVLFTALFVYDYFYHSTALAFAVSLMSASVCAGFVISKTIMFTPIVMVGCAMICAFLIAFASGFDRAQSEIVSSRPLNSIVIGEKGKETQTKMSVRILRTGERGVLYFDTIARSFGLLPWDLVKQIDWPISSIYKR